MSGNKEFSQDGDALYVTQPNSTLHRPWAAPVGIIHCNESPIYALLFWECRAAEFHIHVYLTDLYIPVIGPHIWLQQNRETNPGNI
jgi:hypothetical protein